ncbi:hypothetical protein RNZ50_18500 [Paracoccaceae bacterium Fryx2]|nr:hypothetical protein [Paracoccaceae bacterium Fryx2]
MRASLTRTLNRFRHAEDGAVTVDWVVLSAAVIGIGMFVLMPIALSSESSSKEIADYVAGAPVGYQPSH